MPIPADIEQRLKETIGATLLKLKCTKAERDRRWTEVDLWLNELRESDKFQRWLDPEYYGSEKGFESPAVQRAEILLRKFLSAEQLAELDKNGHFTVKVGKRKFRIRRGISHNVIEVNAQGKKIRTFCAHPDGVPVPDVMLAQKLTLEAQPQVFFSVANVSSRRDDRHLNRIIAAIVPILQETRKRFAEERRIDFSRRLQEALREGLDRHERERGSRLSRPVSVMQETMPAGQDD